MWKVSGMVRKAQQSKSTSTCDKRIVFKSWFPLWKYNVCETNKFGEGYYGALTNFHQARRFIVLLLKTSLGT